MSKIEADKQARLADIADRMKYAKGKSMEMLDHEIDKLLGIESGDASFNRNRERLGNWEMKNRSRS